MLCTSYPLHSEPAFLPRLYERVEGLLSQRAALCLIELTRRAYGPSTGSYGPFTVVVEPQVFAEELGLQLWAVWPALEELTAREFLVPRDGHTIYLFDPNLAMARLRVLEMAR